MNSETKEEIGTWVLIVSRCIVAAICMIIIASGISAAIGFATRIFNAVL